VFAHEAADMSDFENQKKTLIDTQTEARRDEAYRIFQASLRKRYEDEGKIRRYLDRIDLFLQGLVRRGLSTAQESNSRERGNLLLKRSCITGPR
jgi:hypothetical protein